MCSLRKNRLRWVFPTWPTCLLLFHPLWSQLSLSDWRPAVCGEEAHIFLDSLDSLDGKMKVKESYSGWKQLQGPAWTEWMGVFTSSHLRFKCFVSFWSTKYSLFPPRSSLKIYLAACRRMNADTSWLLVLVVESTCWPPGTLSTTCHQTQHFRKTRQFMKLNVAENTTTFKKTQQRYRKHNNLKENTNH